MSWRPRDSDSIRTGSDMITFRPEITINLADTDNEIISQVATQLQDAAAARPVSRAAERAPKLSPRSVVANAMRARVSGLNATTSSRHDSWSPPRYRHDFGRDYGEDSVYPAHTDISAKIWKQGKLPHPKTVIQETKEKVKKAARAAAQKVLDHTTDDEGSPGVGYACDENDTRYSYAYDEGDNHYLNRYHGDDKYSHVPPDRKRRDNHDHRKNHDHQNNRNPRKKDTPIFDPDQLLRELKKDKILTNDTRRRRKSIPDSRSYRPGGVRSKYAMQVL